MPCKYMRSKYNYTPNDYDLEFDFTEIPSNINMDDAVSISRRLAAVTPLSKTIHLHLNTGSKEFNQMMNIHTSMKLNGKEVLFI